VEGSLSSNILPYHHAANDRSSNDADRADHETGREGDHGWPPVSTGTGWLGVFCTVTGAVRVEVPVQRPCAATLPPRPVPFASLPADAVAALAVTMAKLTEYAGRGKWADKAEAAMGVCTRD